MCICVVPACVSVCVCWVYGDQKRVLDPPGLTGVVDSCELLCGIVTSCSTSGLGVVATPLGVASCVRI